MLRGRIAIMIFVVALVIASGACKENTLINSKISPANSTINLHQLYLPCITHTYFDDTAETSTNISGIAQYAAVGSITDPFFGNMTGSAYFSVVPALLDTSFFNSNLVDSAVLVLPYSGFTYGDTLNTSLTQTYQVFYVSDTMGYNSNYFSYNTKPVDASFPLSNPYTVNIHSLGDSFRVLYTLAKNYPGLRIPLKLNNLTERLKPALYTIVNSGDAYQNFIRAFNGVCVRVADTRQSTTAIPYFELDGIDQYSEAGILLYYRPLSNLADSELVTNYYFSNTNCGHFNSISKSFSHYPVNNIFNSVQANDSIIALQNLPGASIDIKIPGITKIPAGIINKAELQIPILPGSYNPSTFQGPEKLYPSGVGNGTYPNSLIGAGLTYVIADYYPISSTSPLLVLDGYAHTVNGIYMYTIDIPREVISSMKAGNDTLHLQINGTQEYYGAFHLVAGGGTYSDTNYRPKLFVVYSK